MITGEVFFPFLSSREQYFSNDILKNSVKNGYLKSRNLSEEKTHPEHRNSVTFVTKGGTKR